MSFLLTGRLIFTDPRLAREVFFGIMTPYQYRLFGPGKWQGAREAILKQNERIRRPLLSRQTTQKGTTNKKTTVACKLIGLTAVSSLICFLFVCGGYKRSIDQLRSFHNLVTDKLIIGTFIKN